jgi:hypothetical protein
MSFLRFQALLPPSVSEFRRPFFRGERAIETKLSSSVEDWSEFGPYRLYQPEGLMKGHPEALPTPVKDQKVLSLLMGFDLTTESQGQFPDDGSNPPCIFRIGLFVSRRMSISWAACADPDGLGRDLPVNS